MNSPLQGVWNLFQYSFFSSLIAILLHKVQQYSRQDTMQTLCSAWNRLWLLKGKRGECCQKLEGLSEELWPREENWERLIRRDGKYNNDYRQLMINQQLKKNSRHYRLYSTQMSIIGVAGVKTGPQFLPVYYWWCTTDGLLAKLFFSYGLLVLQLPFSHCVFNALF